MWRLALIPFVLHAGLMLADETMHVRRGLGAWERWGHPLDTLSVLLCYGLAVRLPVTASGAMMYAAAALGSSAFVTKDEWVHARDCSGAECWLHACLFLLHPVLLGLVGAWAFADLWPGISFAADATGRSLFGRFLAVQLGLTIVFAIWQLLFWNGPWKPSLRIARH